MGEAVDAGCVWALEELFSAGELAAWAAQSVGASYASYTWQGKQWALPLDAATQVAAARRDLIDGNPPATWDEVLRLSEQGGVALCVAGPHAVLSFCSMMVAKGKPPMVDGSAGYFVDEATALAVLDAMASLYRRTSRKTLGLNPIGMLEYMAREADVRYCPLIYGYVNYATPADARSAITFLDVPTVGHAGRRGSTLGGTGIALSRRSRPSPALLDHLRYLMTGPAQTHFIPKHAGQPSHRDAWMDDNVNAESGRFYLNTLATIEDAYVRPRYSGYIAFQTYASAAIRAAFEEGGSRRELIGKLNAEFMRTIDA
ncbi:hypothetical protein ACVBGC_32390 [Burkholderia stagnalis]